MLLKSVFLCNTWLELVRRVRGTKLLDKCKIEPESHSLNTNGTKTQNNVKPYAILLLQIFQQNPKEIIFLSWYSTHADLSWTNM